MVKQNDKKYSIFILFSFYKVKPMVTKIKVCMCFFFKSKLHDLYFFFSKNTCVAMVADLVNLISSSLLNCIMKSWITDVMVQFLSLVKMTTKNICFKMTKNKVYYYQKENLAHFFHGFYSNCSFQLHPEIQIQDGCFVLTPLSRLRYPK